MADKKNLQCAMCHKEYASLEDLERHWGEHFKHYGPTEDSGVKRRDEPKKHKFCDYCNFKTSLTIAMNRHVKINHSTEVKQPQVAEIMPEVSQVKGTSMSAKNGESMAFKQCFQCNFKSIKMSALQLHVKRVHEKVNDHHCTLCDFATSRSDTLERHTKAVHMSEVKDYACSKCSYETKQKYHLAAHTKSVHDKIKDIHCTLCDYKTSERSKLKRHTKIVHIETEVKDHQCTLCGYRTNLIDSLKSQIKSIHDKIKDHHCTLCDYKTSKRSHLKIHNERVHMACAKDRK